jgi:hypothetical protein
MTLTWTPNSTQSGPQGFCAGAIDNFNLQSDPWCITYLVDYTSPNLIQPILVQGSASPIGTVFANQSLFSITGMYLSKILIISVFNVIYYSLTSTLTT